MAEAKKERRPNHVRRREAAKEAREARRGKAFDASHRFSRTGAEKVRMVADQIRGLPINRALDVIRFTKRRGGYLLGKVLKSALANAENQISELKLDIDLDALHVTDVHVDEGPRMKRWMTRARGMAYPFVRPFAHIHVTLEPRAEKEPEAGERRAKKAKKRETAKAETA